MDDQAKIEEAHGLWEIAIVRVSCMVEVGAPQAKLGEAVAEERAAYKIWADASNRATSKA